MNIYPLNNHVQIKPLKRDGVISTHDKNYDEKGIVVFNPDSAVLNGKIVYFDSWMAARYNEGTDDEFWLVPFSAIRAYEDV